MGKTAINRKPHKDSKLRKASDYLEFDIHSLAAAIELYRSNQGNEVGNAALDSLLLRARVLIDFFMGDKALKDDVIAVDFFHDYDSKPYKARKTKKLDKEYEKINKRLMHLTTKPMPRLRSNQRYNVSIIIPPILSAFRQWLSQVPDSRLYKPAKNAREKYKKHLERIEILLQGKVSSNTKA